MKVLFDEREIKNIVSKLGGKLNKWREDGSKADNPPVMLGVLTGGVIFTADLIRECSFLCELDFIGTKSYENNKPGDSLKFTKEPTIDLQGKRIILVEDIIDTGRTIQKVKKKLFNEFKVKSILTVALFARKSKKEELPDDEFLIGEYLDDEFLIGYGFDHLGFFRGLKNICIKS